MNDLYLIHLENIPIQKQLSIEEAFLRTDHRNICIVNKGTPPAIVMGISGKAENFVDAEKWKESSVPILKRFSGGGTVYVDPSTFFISWICNTADTKVEGCPKEIHQWSEKIYQKAFPTLGMNLRENDYVIGERKFGGNAQYLTKGRWLHHTSLLWDYDSAKMGILLLPQKKPAYRQERSHEEFLCRLSEHFSSLEHLQETFLTFLYHSFRVNILDQDSIDEVLKRPHRKATEEIFFEPTT